jgi:hypothetical protein
MGRCDMDVATITHRYLARFKTTHGASTTAEQWGALNAILGCRTGQYGQVHLSCDDCARKSTCYQSCGHRSCNRCQNHSTTQWLQRQVTKLLPVEYFMVTFTLPRELRALAKANQKRVYTLLFNCAVSTLRDFGVNDKAFASELAMSAVLHTHSRRLDYHPHVHIIVPGGGVSKKRNQWTTLNGKYLFNGYKLAAVFKGKLLFALEKSALPLPSTPNRWVVQCQHVGRGLPALKYLSRYLYRGVISDNNILSDDGTFVTFRYKESNSATMQTRQLRGEDFIALLLQHTLPKSFRRARDYGFLHGNAKRLLKTVQWFLKVNVVKPQPLQRPAFICEHCQAVMSIVGFTPPLSRSG